MTTPTRDELHCLESAYLAVLRLPDGSIRTANQLLLCRLRDTLAKALGRSEESVQNEYEQRALLSAHQAQAEPVAWEPKFDVMSPEQEQLAIQFCEEIAGRRGGKGSAPDPVRLLEMAESLYQAERADHVISVARPSQAQEPSKQEAPSKRQYYYRVTGCTADGADSLDCKCWHDEGTGPMADAADSIKSWRAAAPTTAAQAKEGAEPVSGAVDGLPSLPAPVGTMQMNWGTPDEKDIDGYTADQMRGYAIDALLSRAQQAPAVSDVYRANILESCATWLEGRAATTWAKEYGHSWVMTEYAKDLRRIRALLPPPAAAPVSTQQAPAKTSDALGQIEFIVEEWQRNGEVGSDSAMYQIVDAIAAANQSAAPVSEQTTQEQSC